MLMRFGSIFRSFGLVMGILAAQKQRKSNSKPLNFKDILKPLERSSNAAQKLTSKAALKPLQGG